MKWSGIVLGMLACVAASASQATTKREQVPASADVAAATNASRAWEIGVEALHLCETHANATSADDRCFDILMALIEYAPLANQTMAAERYAMRALDFARSPAARPGADLAFALNNYGFMLFRSGRNAEAEPLLRQALGLYARTRGFGDDTALATLRNLVAVLKALGKDASIEARWPNVKNDEIGGPAPPPPPHPRWVVPAAVAFAYEHGDFGKRDARRAELAKTRASCLAAAGPEDRCFLLDLHYSRELLGDGDALAAAKLATALAASALKWYGRSDPDLIDALTLAARASADFGLVKDAEDLHRTALGIITRRSGMGSPAWIDASVDHAAYLANLGRAREAFAMMDLSIAAMGKLPDYPLLAKAAAFRAIGQMTLIYGSADDAERLALAALTLERREFADTLIGSGDTLALLSDVYRARGDYGVAESLARQSLEWATRRYGDDSPQAMTALASLTSTLSERGHSEAAVPLLRRILAVARQRSGPSHPSVAAALNNLAVALDKPGEAAEAEANMRAAMAILTPLQGTEHRDVLTLRANLAVHLDTVGRAPDAERELRALLQVDDRVLGPTDMQTAFVLFSLAHLLIEKGRDGEAFPLLDRARSIYGSRAGGTSPLTIRATLASGRVLLRTLKRPAEARAFYLEASKGVAARIALGQSHGVDADHEMTSFRAAFTGLVAADWALTRPR